MCVRTHLSEIRSMKGTFSKSDIEDSCSCKRMYWCYGDSLGSLNCDYLIIIDKTPGISLKWSIGSC